MLYFDTYYKNIIFECSWDPNLWLEKQDCVELCSERDKYSFQRLQTDQEPPENDKEEEENMKELSHDWDTDFLRTEVVEESLMVTAVNDETDTDSMVDISCCATPYPESIGQSATVVFFSRELMK